MKKQFKNSVSTATTQYLLQHNYPSDAYDESLNEQTIEEMVESKVIENQICLSQAFSLTNSTVEPQKYEQLYTQFLALSQDEPQLKVALLPVFVHICLQLVQSGHSPVALKFYKHRATSVGKGADQNRLISALDQSEWEPDMVKKGTLKEVWDNKYSITLPQSAHRALLSFLSKTDNGMLSYIFNRFIDIQMEKTKKETVTRPKIVVTSLPPVMPPVAMYTLHGSAACNIAIDPRDSRIACCLEDSTILLHPPASSPSQSSQSGLFLDGDSPVEQTSSRHSPCVLRGHTGAVYSAAFHDQYLLSCSADHTVGCWSLSEGELMTLYKGHNHYVWDVAVNSSGPTFATCSEDRTARLWTTELTYPIRTFVGHLEGVDVIAMHPNGQYIATGSSDGCIRLWSVSDASSVRLFVHHSPVTAVSFSCDGQIIAAATADKNISLWELSSGKTLHKLETSAGQLTSLHFNSINSLLLSTSLDGLMTFYDVRSENVHNDQTPAVVGQITLAPVNLHRAVFSPGNYVVAAGINSLKMS